MFRLCTHMKTVKKKISVCFKLLFIYVFLSFFVYVDS